MLDIFRMYSVRMYFTLQKLQIFAFIIILTLSLQRNTFQTIVATDSVHTYVLNIYYDMQWEPIAFE